MAQGDRAWGLGSIHHMRSLCCFSTHSEDSFPCSSTGSLSWKQSFINSSSLSPWHGLQFSMNCSSGVPSTECSPSGTMWVPHGGLKVCHQTCSRGGFSLHRVTGPVRTLMGLALARAAPFWAVWHWLYQTWQKLLATCSRSHPCSPLIPLTTKTWPHKPRTDKTAIR